MSQVCGSRARKLLTRFTSDTGRVTHSRLFLCGDYPVVFELIIVIIRPIDQGPFREVNRMRWHPRIRVEGRRYLERGSTSGTFLTPGGFNWASQMKQTEWVRDHEFCIGPFYSSAIRVGVAAPSKKAAPSSSTSTLLR